MLIRVTWKSGSPLRKMVPKFADSYTKGMMLGLSWNLHRVDGISS